MTSIIQTQQGHEQRLRASLKLRRAVGPPLPLTAARRQMARDLSPELPSRSKEEAQVRAVLLYRTALLDVAIYGAVAVFPEAEMVAGGKPRKAL